MAKKGNETDILLFEIGKKLKQLRIDAEYSSYETFANDYDLDRKQYWRIENGTNLTLSTLNKILKIHKVSFQEFFKGIE